MIIKVQDLKKADVITRQGDKLPKIKNILFDPAEKRVIALVTSKPSVLSEAKVIQMDNVEEMTSQAVIVDSKDAEKKASQISKTVSQLTKDKKYRLNKGKIIGDDATEFGSISDTFIDSDSGKIAGFEVSQGKVKDIQEGKKTMKITEIVSVGEEAVIVKPKIAKSSDEIEIPPQEVKRIIGNGDQPEPKMSEPDPKIVQAAIGKYLLKNILTNNDQLFARQGDIVTNEMVQAAYTNGLLDQIMQNVANKPA